MSVRPLYLATIAIAALTLGACRGDSGNGDDQTGDDGVDAGDDEPILPDGCSALSPRMVPPETFVGPDGLQPRMIALIDGATESLDIQMYLWTVRPIANAVVAAHQRGVDVRVILDPDSPGNAAVRPTLTNANVPVRNAPGIFSFSHAKYMVIDGDTAVIMSMNWNVDAMDEERNYGMIDRDPDDVADVKAIFEQDWAHAAGEMPTPADLACTRLVVSPTNSKNRLLAHIRSADEALDLEIMYLSETEIRDAIIATAQRGVPTRVILGDDADDSIPMLKAAGVTVKTATTYRLHSKLIVADGVVFVGSENMSLTSLTRNREVGALVFEPGPAAIVTSQFAADWAAGRAL